MNNPTPTTALRDVIEALDKATPGEWFPGHLCNDDHSCTCPYIFSEAQNGMGAIATIGVTEEEVRDIEEAKANQRSIVLAVNFMREHGRRALAVMEAVEAAPVAIMDTRDALGICAPTEDDFPALYALQGKRVRLVLVGEA